MAPKKMDKKKLENYKKVLVKMKGDFVHDINSMSQNPTAMQSDAGHVQHMADVATDMYDREFNLGLASNEREVLNRVNEAIKRIDEDSFGTCLKCEKMIPVARLKAIPYVENCLKCQEEIEEAE